MLEKLRYYKRLSGIFKNYRKRNVLVSSLPVRMWVELDSRCNLTCVMCPNRDLEEKDKGYMTPDLFKKVVDEAAGFIQEMTLHHRGESLKHPDAIKLITYASKKIPVTKLHTNGTLLDDRMIDGLLQSDLTRISFSFDGFEKEDYEKIRVGADFDQVVGNIKRLLNKRNESGGKTPSVAIELIELNQSQMEKENKREFIRQFKGIGLDEMVIKKPHNWAGSLHLKYSKKNYSPCTFLWNALLVLWNGDVVPCAQDFFAKYKLGNVTENSLVSIWNDEPMKKLRQGLKDGRYKDFPACADCDRLWRDTIMGIPKEYLKKFLLNRMP